MQLYFIDFALWWATPVLMSCVAIAMYRDAGQLAFTYVFNYVVEEVLPFAVAYPLRNCPKFF